MCYVHAKSLQLCPTLCNTMDCSLSGSSVHGIPRLEYWSGVPCPPPGDLPHPRIEPMSPVAPAWQVDSLPLSYHISPIPPFTLRNFQKCLDYPLIKTCRIKSVPCDRNLMDADSRIFVLTCQLFNHAFMMPHLLLWILSDLQHHLISGISPNENKTKWKKQNRLTSPKWKILS